MSKKLGQENRKSDYERKLEMQSESRLFPAVRARQHKSVAASGGGGFTLEFGPKNKQANHDCDGKGSLTVGLAGRKKTWDKGKNVGTHVRKIPFSRTLYTQPKSRYVSKSARRTSGREKNGSLLSDA